MNVSLCLCFKTSPRVKMSPVGANHMNGFAFRLVLTQKQNATRKWPIG